MLRPAGKIIINDDVYDAVSLYSYIDKGKSKIVDFQNNQLIVEPMMNYSNLKDRIEIY